MRPMKNKISSTVSWTIAILLFSTAIFAQSPQELETKLASVSEKERPGILNQLAEANLKNNSAKSIEYGEQALKESKKNEDVENEAAALINLGDAYSLTKNQKKAFQYFKSAIKIYDDYSQPSNSAYVWNKIADSYLEIDNYDDAIDANLKAMDLFKKSNEKTGVVNMNIEVGDIYLKQKKFENALPYFKQALGMYENSRDARGQVTILSRIGTTYSNWGNYDEALIFFNKALESAQKNSLKTLEKSIQQNIEVVTKNYTSYQKSRTDFSKKKDELTQQQIKAKEDSLKLSALQINTLSTKNIKSIEEIEKLSIEAQVKEFKIKSQQQEILQKQAEAETQIKANQLLKSEKELVDSKLKTQQLIIWGAIAFSILGVILTVIIFIAYRNKKKSNILLVQKNEVIYKQRGEIEKKNIQITDSIDYAKSIQEAILPPPTILSNYFSESFIYYKPKDIVSGDFYWVNENTDSVFIAAADCTGHGVPGAFMSLLGFIMLNDIVRTNKNETPAYLLNEVNNILLTTLHQNHDTMTGKFGMDIALIKFDKIKNEITYSGAHNSVIILSEGQMNEIKADKVSIGATMNSVFTNHTVSVKKGDMVYLYSDGYQDQIGGEKRKKFLSLTLKDLFKQIQSLPAEKQTIELEKHHAAWKGANSQTDDILVVGLKI